MSAILRIPLYAVAGIALAACMKTVAPVQVAQGVSPEIVKPSSSLLPTVKVAKATGWAEGETPVAADGLKVVAFATGLDHPRWMHVLPNGDVLVAETNAPARAQDGGGIRSFFTNRALKKAGAAVPSADRITLLRDADGDGVAETQTIFMDNLYSPFGMALIGETLYIANADAIVSVPYEDGMTEITVTPETLTDLPGGPLNHHWTKNIVASEDGTKLYASVGSNSNIGENGLEAEDGRAAVWEVDVATGDKRVFASGLRNPVGMDWNPANGELWVAVNERDGLGNNLVPDYMTAISQGEFFGWPFSYWGQIVDTRVTPQSPEQVARAIAPDYALGAHTASLGLAFSEDARLGPDFSSGAFVGQHGSWNRNPRSGYKVVFVPFTNGEPDGLPVDVLTGFLDDDEARGRPTGVVMASDGALLVADDVGNTIWRVASGEVSEIS